MKKDNLLIWFGLKVALEVFFDLRMPDNASKKLRTASLTPHTLSS
jgi:hypothetical protein